MDTICPFFTSTDTILFGTNANNAALYVPRSVGAFFVIWSVTIVLRGKIKKDLSLLIICFFIGILMLNLLVNNENPSTIVSRIISILVAYCIVNIYDQNYFVNIFDRVMFMIAKVAIIIEIIAYIFPKLIYLFPSVTNTANGIFATCIVGGLQLSNISQFFIRASGPFWEPGAFAIYLVLAIMNQLFFLKMDIKKVIAYVICLIITFSTTGYIALAGVFIVYTMYSDSGKVNRYLKTGIVGILLLGIFVLLFGQNTSIYEMLFGKIVSNSSTSVTRYASIINGLQIGFDYPMFGVGPNKLGDYMAMYAMKTTVMDLGANPWNTNTTTYQFAAYGAIFGIVFVIGYIRYFRKSCNKFLLRIGLLIVVLLAYCGEAYFSFLPYVFVFYGYSNRNSGGYISESGSN